MQDKSDIESLCRDALDVEPLLRRWNAPDVLELIARRGVDIRKWEIFVRSESGAESGADIAWSMQISRARVCQIVKEVRKRLEFVPHIERTRLYRRPCYQFLRTIEPTNLISARSFLRSICPDPRNPPDRVLCRAGGKEWVIYDSCVWSEEGHANAFLSRIFGGRRFAIIWCNEAHILDWFIVSPLRLSPFFSRNTPLLFNCDQTFYAFDHIRKYRGVTNVWLKPLEYTARWQDVGQSPRKSPRAGWTGRNKE